MGISREHAIHFLGIMISSVHICAIQENTCVALQKHVSDTQHVLLKTGLLGSKCQEVEKIWRLLPSLLEPRLSSF